MFEGPVQDLIDELGRLPGIGPKSAQRLAFHILAAEEMMTESLVARVMAWMAEKRTEVNNDPRIVPGILGVAEPITVPTW